MWVHNTYNYLLYFIAGIKKKYRLQKHIVYDGNFCRRFKTADCKADAESQFFRSYPFSSFSIVYASENYYIPMLPCFIYFIGQMMAKATLGDRIRTASSSLSFERS